MTDLIQIATDYAVGIKAAFKEKNPEWAQRDGHDQLLGKVISLIGELSIETGTDVCIVALDHDWQTTCFGTGEMWFDLAGRVVDEVEVYAMANGGVWMVLSDGIEWNFKAPVLQ